MPPSGFVCVARVADIPPGEALAVVAGDREVGLFNVAGRLYALDNICPHQGAPLSEGPIANGAVTCPWHAWCFELSTGNMKLGGYEGVQTFEVLVDDGNVYVSSEPRAAGEMRGSAGPKVTG